MERSLSAAMSYHIAEISVIHGCGKLLLYSDCVSSFFPVVKLTIECPKEREVVTQMFEIRSSSSPADEAASWTREGGRARTSVTFADHWKRRYIYHIHLGILWTECFLSAARSQMLKNANAAELQAVIVEAKSCRKMICVLKRSGQKSESANKLISFCGQVWPRKRSWTHWILFAVLHRMVSALSRKREMSRKNLLKGSTLIHSLSGSHIKTRRHSFKTPKVYVFTITLLWDVLTLRLFFLSGSGRPSLSLQ